MLNAQTIHEVMVLDNEFSPSTLDIEAGDTVRWINPANNGAPHNVVSSDFLWTPFTPTENWNFEFTFDNAGSFDYFCAPHQALGMTGVVNVTGSTNTGSGVDLGVAHNGNWWNGPARNGEGVQVELSDAGNDDLVFVATMYTYTPEGDQIFMVAVGTPDGESVEVEIIISEGGVWGDDYDAANINQPTWGTGTFTSLGCDALDMTLTPNATYQAQGHTELSYELERLTTSLIACEEPDAN